MISFVELRLASIPEPGQRQIVLYDGLELKHCYHDHDQDITDKALIANVQPAPASLTPLALRDVFKAE